MPVSKFEDLIVWQRSRELTKLVYKITRNGSFQKDYGLKDQIQRAAVSVMSNIAEGFGRGGNKEFTQFLFISKGSLAEVQSLLYVALDQTYLAEADFQNAYKKAIEVSRLTTSFVKGMKTSAVKGLKQ